MSLKAEYSTNLAGVDFIDAALPRNFRREALSPFAEELSLIPCGAIIAHLSGRIFVLLLKHGDTDTNSLWWGAAPELVSLAREAYAPIMWPVRQI